MVVDFSWAELPFDLLRAIAMRLECVQDMLAFADVCSSWRAVYVNLKSVWIPVMPWLIMAENNDDNPQFTRTLVDLNNNKRYQMKLPETFGRRCWGCEHSWIFTLGLDLEPHLFNPLTRARLRLPSVLALPFEYFDINDIDHRRRLLLRRNYIQKVHVICIPPNDELLVMVIYQKTEWAYIESEWAYTNPGASEWTSLKFDLEDSFDIDYLYVYLVASPDDLLVVLRYAFEGDSEGELIQDTTVSYVTSDFTGFAFDVYEREWFADDDLGDMALFVGNNTAMSVRALECANCKPNCIYFTDERPCGDPKVFLGHDS